MPLSTDIRQLVAQLDAMDAVRYALSVKPIVPDDQGPVTDPIDDPLFSTIDGWYLSNSPAYQILAQFLPDPSCTDHADCPGGFQCICPGGPPCVPDGTCGLQGADGANIGWHDAVQDGTLESIRTTGEEVVIAIVETPFDYTHPDLKDHVWTNHLECCGQAQCPDGDQDGLPECVSGEAIPGGCPGACGVDDDGDGFADWEDPEVRLLIHRLCTNGVDDDGDGQPDEPDNCHGEEALAAEDDDENGFIDDAHGFHFQAASTDGERAGGTVVPHQDELGHTTAVAGVVAATINNGLYTAGVHPKARVAMAAFGRFVPGDIEMTTELVPAALRYASLIGADVVNMSWSTRVPEVDAGSWQAYQADIRKHEQLFFEGFDPRILYVTSAGNFNSVDLDRFPTRPSGGIWYFPNNIETNYLLVITATNLADLYAEHYFSERAVEYDHGGSYGATVVDFAAPGDLMGLLVPAPDFTKVSSGTSFSSPLTAAVAGLVISRFPDELRGQPLRTAARLVQTLDTSADSPNLSSLCPPGGIRRVKHCGRVSVPKALDEVAYPLYGLARFVNETWRLHDRGIRLTRSLSFVDRDGDDVMDFIVEVSGARGAEEEYVQVLEPLAPLTVPYDPLDPGITLVNRTLGEDGEPSDPGDPDDDRIELKGSFGAVAYTDVDGDGCTDAIVAGLSQPDQTSPWGWSGSTNKMLIQITDAGGQCTGRFEPRAVWMFLGTIGLMLDVDVLNLNNDGVVDMIFTGTWDYVTGIPGGDPANLMLASSGGPMYWQDETASRVHAWDAQKYGFSEKSTTCDLDGDGDVDIIQATSRSVGRFLINDGTGMFADVPFPVQALSGASGDVVCVDISGPDGTGGPDGLPEVIFARRGHNRENVLLLNNTSGGSLSLEDGRYLLPPNDNYTNTAAVCDLDGDGDLDLLFGNGEPSGYPEHNRVVLRNSASGLFYATAGNLGLDFDHVLGTTRSIQCVSLDPGGTVDAVLIGNYGGQNSLYLRRRP